DPDGAVPIFQGLPGGQRLLVEKVADWLSSENMEEARTWLKTTTALSAAEKHALLQPSQTGRENGNSNQPAR
nr:hypothetical protein [Verrucomicrobiota bacterium]